MLASWRDLSAGGGITAAVHVLCLCLALPVASARPGGGESAPATADFHVSVRGDDAWPGTRVRPFRTIQRARDAVREHKRRVADRDIVVEIAGGDYFLDLPLVFDERDSGVNGHRVIYRAHAGERARLIGGRRVTQWEKIGDGLWRTRIEKGDAPSQLFENGVPALLTRYPERGYLHTAGIAHDEDPRRTFSYKPQDLPDALDLDQARVYIWGGQDWFSDYHAIAKLDRAAHTITMTGEVAYRTIEQRAARRYCLYNIRALLGAPGRFYVDFDAGYLYYTPVSADIEAQEIVIPTLVHVVELQGSSREAPVTGITLEGLALEVSAFGDSFSEMRDGENVTPRNEPANRKGLIYMENACGCAVRCCEISDAGYAGVCLNRFAQDNVISGNHIHDAGYHGVLLAGYNAHRGRAFDYNKRNRIENNWIHHCGRLVGHSAGIFGYASGENLIAHNLIHHMPRYGISFKGNSYIGPSGFQGKVIAGEQVTWENHWDFQHARRNVIEFNHIHHVNQDSEDSGAISFKACGKGNIVNHNLIHDCPRDPDSLLGEERIKAAGYALNQGIYLDDESDYFTVSNNIVYNLNDGWDNRAFCILAKGVSNTIVNNILVGDPFTDAGIHCYQPMGYPTCEHVYAHNVIWMQNPSACPLQITGAVPDYHLSSCDDNVYWIDNAPCRIKVQAEEIPFAEWRNRYGAKFDQRTLVADPKFADPAHDDYRLRDDSPAYDLGFKAIDLGNIGLTDNPYYTSGAVEPDEVGVSGPD